MSDPGTLFPKTEAALDDLMRIVRSRLAEKDAEIAALREPAPCGACAGDGVPVSGGVCICGGRGTQDGEMDGLRDNLFSARDEIAALKAQVARLIEAGDELYAHVECQDRGHDWLDEKWLKAKEAAK